MSTNIIFGLLLKIIKNLHTIIHINLFYVWNWRNRNTKREVRNQSFKTGKLNTGKMGERGVYKLAVLLNSKHKMSIALSFAPPPKFTPSSSFSCEDVSYAP